MLPIKSAGSLFLVAGIFLLFFQSCQKEKQYCPKTSYVYPQSITVIEGWPVYFDIYTDHFYTHEWSGPNNLTNLVHYPSNDSDELKWIPAALPADSGDYVIKTYDEDHCMKYVQKYTVHVTQSQAAPCSLNDNVLVSAGPLLSGTNPLVNYSTDIAFGESDCIQYKFLMQTGTPLYIFFKTNGEPLRQGVYPINSVTPPDNETECSVRLFSDMSYHPITAGNVYVTKENGLLVISFCDLILGNGYNQNNSTFSFRYIIE